MKFQLSESNPFQLQLSFNKIIEHWEKLAASPGVKSELAKQLLKEIEPYPELKSGITDFNWVKNNPAIINNLLSELFPAALTNNEIKAVTLPYQHILINPTERLQNILNSANPTFDICIRNSDEHQLYVMSCCLIMNRFYGTNFDFSSPLFYDIPTAEGVIKHYRIIYNGDFLELIPTEISVAISQSDIELLRDNFDDLQLWKQKFPPGSWLVKGFAIVSLFDATVENALSALKETLLGERSEELRKQLLSIFRSIFNIPDLHIGFAAFNASENKFSVPNFNQSIPSFLLSGEEEKDADKALCNSAIDSLIEQKTYYAVADVPAFLAKNKDNNFIQHFNNQHIKSFILAPVLKNNRLIGVFEVISYKNGQLNSINANRLNIVMPFLTDTIDRQFTELQNRIRALIQIEYTSIHPSVYWKFEKEALKSIQYRIQKKEYALKEVVFEEVYPLYGQIDIKDSSITRNKCLQLDLQKQALAILTILEQLQSEFKDAASEYIPELNDLMAQLAFFKADTEQQFYHFLDIKVYPLFNLAISSESVIKSLISDYFLHSDKVNGDFHSNRREYDKTITLINAKMALMLDHAQVEAQTRFPHYFERFKTDGIEHNLYIGSSIIPERKFELTDLYNLRLWQIQVLCEMEMEHHFQKASLPYPLEVTSLILVFNNPISIRFRTDEKQFDVDGAYNARYEVVKKRIDKAFVKGTSERITAIGKLTIVYSNKEEEWEYITYIQFLQSKQMLDDGIEMLEIEDLQGVSGLKALRVKILYTNELPFTKRYDYTELLHEMHQQNVS
jgi:hypothetical protein